MIGEDAAGSVKVCIGCNIEKTLDAFHKSSRHRLGRVSKCKACAHAYYLGRRDQSIANARDLYWQNPEPKREYARARYAARRAEFLPKMRDYRLSPRGREVIRAFYSRIDRRVHNSIRLGIRKAIRGGKRGRRTWEIVGYSPEELMLHLERQFAPGMGWENYGEWHIDHVIPLSSFEIAGPDDPKIRQAWDLPNLRPLWAQENIRKSDRRLLLL